MMLQFDLSPLIGAQPGERLVFSLDEGPCRLEDVSVEFLLGELQFTRVQQGILLTGALESEVEVECVRCLEPFCFAFSGELEDIIGISENSGTPYFLTDEGWLDVSPLLREQVWLAIPIKPLCSLECQGLCPQCGVNLNREECDCRQERVDPRMQVLASLLEGGQEQE